MRTTVRYRAHQVRGVVNAVVTADERRNVRRMLEVRGRGTLDLRLPWLSFALVDFLADWITPGMRVFEYGGGGSTAWFLDRGCEVVTVEHDQEWFDHLAQQEWPADSRSELLWGDPADDFAGYVDAIGTFDDASFDIVVVDGRRRVRCVQAAKSKVKPGGLLVLDDIDRADYAPAFAVMSPWLYRQWDGFSPGRYATGHTGVWVAPPVGS